MNLFVGNLSPETTEGKLRELFSEFGPVVSVKILIDPTTGMPRGFGFVEMADKFHAFDAMDNLDATYLEGTIISVKEAKQNNGPDRRGGNDRGFSPRPNNRNRDSNRGSGGGGGGYNRNSNRY